MTVLTLNNSIFAGSSQDGVNFSSGMTIGEVIELIKSACVDEGEFWVETRLDGQLLRVREDEELLKTVISQYQRIDFSIKNSLTFSLDALDTCIRQLDALVVKIKATVQSYQANKIAQGHEQFIALAEQLNLFVELVTSLHNALRASGQGDTALDKTLQSLEINLLSIVKGLILAKKKCDIAMLCDLLQYELVDNLVRWKIEAMGQFKRYRVVGAVEESP